MKRKYHTLCQYADRVVLAISFLLATTIYLHANARQSNINKGSDPLSIELRKKLYSMRTIKKMNYPASVQRFYRANGMKPNWLNGNGNIGPTASAMLLLDCLRQFGLERKNYHPEILTYDVMQKAIGEGLPMDKSNRIDFEIFLTDAMISMANHLHYGRFNPIFDLKKIESGKSVPFRAEKFLLKVATDDQLMYAITGLQPKMGQYRILQEYLRLMTGQYTCDSYEVPEAEVKKISINLERLRWNATNATKYFFVNIPAFELTYTDGDSTSNYLVVVGKRSTPTPLLQGMITEIETAPDWLIPQKIFIQELLPKAEKDLLFFDRTHTAIYDIKGSLVPVTSYTLREIRKRPQDFQARQSPGCDNALGSVVFRFYNPEGIYLHDTPIKEYFLKANRALSHGCIRIEDAPSLARRLIVADGNEDTLKSFDMSIATNRKLRYKLDKSVPITISYQTITVRDGLLINYPDIYQLDNELIKRMYEQPQTSRAIKKR